MDFISGIIALAKALPTLDKWLQKLLLKYAESRVAKWDKEILNGIVVALQGDQRALEKAINNPNAGLPSGNPGTVIKPPEWMP